MTNPVTHAALESAARDLEHLLQNPPTNPAAAARSYLDGLRSAGWTHPSERAAPPEPTGPVAPPDSPTAVQALRECRRIADDAIRRRQTEGHEQP